MSANDLSIGSKFKNKETRVIIEVIELDGEKVFASDCGIWDWVDEDLYFEV